jgi:hypothetical protein
MQIKSIFYGILVLLSLARIATANSNKVIQLPPERTRVVWVHSARESDKGGNSNGPILKNPSQRYFMITDILDGFGGLSKSTGYEIPYCSEGQTFFMGIMESSNYQVKSGYIWAIDIKRGDVNQDGFIDVGDVVNLLNYLFRGGDQPLPMETADSNCNGEVDVGDVVYLINYLFGQGPSPCN